MESILVLTHTALAEDCACGPDSALTKASFEAVSAGHELAERLGAPLTVGIVGSEAATSASMLASLGARLLSVTGEMFAHPRYASDAAACEALCRASGATIILAPHSSRFARVMAGVAHRIGGAIDTHVTAIAGTSSIEA